MPTEPLRVTGSLVIPGEELEWRFSRASGPGGQGVNTTDSRVQLRWDVAESAVLTESQRSRLLGRLAPRLVAGVLQVTAAETRSQRQNRQVAQQRLAEIVAAGLAPPPRKRRPTMPTRGSVVRRIEGKRRRSDVKRLRRNLGD